MPLNKVIMTQIREAARLIIDSKYVTALTGAGVSVESGIRPFRGPGGIWTERGEPPMDGYRRFEEDPKQYWEETLNPDRRSGFGDSITAARPNSGHLAFAELETMGILKSLITQNIDNLHTKAGSRKVLEIHGNRLKLRCVSCGKRFPREGFKIITLPPHCPECDGIVKDDVVMFGEPIPRDVLDACQAEATRSDCMIVAGTSAIVYPAASLPLIVRNRGGVIIEVNPLESELSKLSDIVVRAQSGESLPALVEAVKKLF
jgi:NAD-dependent deacetylase